MRSFTRFGLSATQLVATALAAVTATVAGSFLGVTGTVIGAALASLISAVGTAVYAHSLRRFANSPRSASPAAETGTPRGELTPRGRWQVAMLGALTVFVTLLVVLTGIEVVTGRPLSDLVRGETGSGTTLFGDTRRAAADEPAPAGTVTRTVTPSVVVTTPTVTETAPPVTSTATPTVTVRPTPTTTPIAPTTEPSPNPTPSS